jgi:hypothetical protein
MSIEIPTVEMAKCEGCGQYHPVEECEIVVIRMVKGKNCPINQPQKQVFTDVVRERDHTPTLPVMRDVVDTLPPSPPQQKRRSIVPRDILSMMVDPNDPKHASVAHLAATETRRAG